LRFLHVDPLDPRRAWAVGGRHAVRHGPGTPGDFKRSTQTPIDGLADRPPRGSLREAGPRGASAAERFHETPRSRDIRAERADRWDRCSRDIVEAPPPGSWWSRASRVHIHRDPAGSIDAAIANHRVSRFLRAFDGLKQRWGAAAVRASASCDSTDRRPSSTSVRVGAVDPANVVIIWHGSQGVSYSALSLMARHAEHKWVEAQGGGDTVRCCPSSLIPGNEPPIPTAWSTALYRSGADVYHGAGPTPVHRERSRRARKSSDCCCRWWRPRWFMPGARRAAGSPAPRSDAEEIGIPTRSHPDLPRTADFVRGGADVRKGESGCRAGDDLRPTVFGDSVTLWRRKWLRDRRQSWRATGVVRRGRHRELARPAS